MSPSALLAILLMTSAPGQVPDVELAPATAQIASTEKPFDEALARRLSVQWQKVPLRQVLRRLGDTAKISILLDRRLDPDRDVNLEVSDEPVQKILERVAHDQSASVRRVGHVAYLCPERSASVIRTLVAVRRSEAKQATIPANRQQALAHRETLAWGDLQQPNDLLDQVARRFSLHIEDKARLPHDLWNRGAFPQMSAAEMLSLLLIQYDSTFEWTSGGNGIRLVPLPRRVVLTQPHAPPRGKTAAQAADTWRQTFPDADFTVRPGEVSVTAPLEIHESIELSKKSSTSVASSEPAPAKSDDLSRQRFTMQQVREVPLTALIKTLSSPSGAGLTFTHDEAELKQAGIRLEQRITLNVKNATIQTLLQKSLDQVGLDFELRGHAVRLFPKQKRPAEKQ